VFLTETNHVKIGDFGLAASLVMDQTDGKVKGVEGTTNYMAPEVFSKAGATEKADIWSLGCIMYEMLEGESLTNARKSFGLVAHENPNWKAEAQFSQLNLTQNPQLTELACAMLVVDPVKRPSLTNLIAAFTAARQCRGGLDLEESTQISTIRTIPSPTPWP